MQVAQLPASQENGGRRPPRRAVSSRVSPGWYRTTTVLPPRITVTSSARAPRVAARSAAAVDQRVGLLLLLHQEALDEDPFLLARRAPCSVVSTRSMKGPGPQM